MHYAVNAINVVLLIGRAVVDTGQALKSDDYMMTLRKARNNEKPHLASGKLLRLIYKKNQVTTHDSGPVTCT